MRKTRARAAQDNREAVIAAARRNFEERGYHGATLESIAEEAGFSKGVVYSQFGSKDELFLAVLEDNIERRHGVTQSQFGTVTAPADLVALAALATRESVRTVAWQAALLEFRAHAWRHPELNARYRELHRRAVESIAGFIGAIYRANGEEPPAPPGEMAVVGMAASTGALVEFMADPSIEVDAIAHALGNALASTDPTKSHRKQEDGAH